MEHPNEFIELLRQIMSQEPKPLISKENIKQLICELDVLDFVGGKIVVWIN